MSKLVFALAAVAAAPAVAASATAATIPYQATYVEPAPINSGFACAPGTSCGSASISGLGHSDNQVVEFNACGFGCHIRTVTFDDGSTLVIRTEDQPSGFAFSSPGNSGQHGYIGFPGFAGNPQFLEIKETIIGGTGRFVGASGGGTGTVKLHGGMAIGKTSGTITIG